MVSRDSMRRVVVWASGRGLAEDGMAGAGPASTFWVFCFVLFALQLSVCLWWHDYRRDGFPTLKFVVVIADLARHLLREEPFALSATPTIWAGKPGCC